METLWKEVKSAIKACVPGHCYRMWIDPVDFGRMANDQIVLQVPNFFSQKRVREQYGQLIESEFAKRTGTRFNVLLEVLDPNHAREKPVSAVVQQLVLPGEQFHACGGRMLRRDFTFDRFVVGKNNDFAYSAALSQACRKQDSQTSLFLLSKTGLGKSHLSQAIGHQVLKENPKERVYYITAEDFTNEMVTALRTDAIEGFKEKYRSGCDVLLMEDVHFLTGKDRTQMELALTLDYLFDANKKIIFTSCYLPGDIPKMSEQLRSRLSCGLISGIEAPDFHTRVRILQKKALAKGFDIPAAVIDYMASELTDDVRQMESGMISLATRSKLLGCAIDVPLAESVIKNYNCNAKKITIDAIKKLVCKEFNITLADIVSRSRKQSIVRPRQVAIFLSRKYTDSPLQAIGKSFNRYHATAMHSINAVEKDIRANGPLEKQVEFLSKKLESGKF
jgi:chromosomal replication initiator protein